MKYIFRAHGHSALINVIVLAVIGTAFFYGGHRIFDSVRHPSSTTEISPQKILNLMRGCYDNEKKNTCFKQLANDLVAHHQLADVFEALEKNQQAPKIFESCHVFLHFAGQAAYKKFGSVPHALRQGSHVVNSLAKCNCSS